MNKKIVFTNSRKHKLSGILSISTKSHKELIVIFAHGLGSNKESEKYEDFKKLLIKKDIGVFRFDFHGHGESEGKFEDVTINEGADDVDSAINYLKNLGYKNIGLVGTSFGGISSIMAASKNPDLKFLGLIAPVSIPEKLSELRSPETDMLKKPFHLDKINNGYKIADKIKMPVFIVHGDKDNVVPISHSIEFCKLLSDCKLEIIKGGDHRLRTNGNYERVLKLMSDFIFSFN